MNFQTVPLTVAYHLITGLICEEEIYRPGDPKPIHTGYSLGGPNIESHSEAYNRVFTFAEGHQFPERHVAYRLDYRLTLFETDVPPQHMWAPASGKDFKVLWTKSFEQQVAGTAAK